MKCLDSVTLLGIDGGGNRPLITKAMQYSKRELTFGRSLLLSPHCDYADTDDIDIVNINAMDYNEWNRFTIQEIHKYIDTPHYLYVDTDGFVIHPELWTDEFLNYDYAGAPFYYQGHIQSGPCVDATVKAKPESTINLVGNGGFTLRSKKLAEAMVDCPDIRYVPEDVYITLNNYDYFVSKGITYCPLDLAYTFAQNRLQDSGNSFGFHGDKNHIHNV